MPEIAGYKALAGSLPPDVVVWVPREPNKWLNRLQFGKDLLLKITSPRNYAFHKKWFALLGFGYGAWEPDAVDGPSGRVVCKNFDTFREWVTVKAGYAEYHITPEGRLRAVAKSVSFAKMTEEEFDDLYQKSVEIIWQNILVTYTKQDIDDVLRELNGF